MTFWIERAEARLAELGGATAQVDTPAAAATSAVFRQEGEFWTLAFEGETVRLKDSKGMAFLATLLANPGREHHVLDLQVTVRTGTYCAYEPDPRVPIRWET